tara:strand:- start:271 stop:591 length:321 start_codon:yes stop_codon:yes gene_type:complete
MQQFKLKQKEQFFIVSDKNNVITLQNLKTKKPIIIMRNDFNSIFNINDDIVEYTTDNEPTYEIHKSFDNFKNYEDRYILLVNNIGSILKVSRPVFDENYYELPETE